MIVIRIIMIIIRIMIIIMYCITYDMVSIMSCSALFDYVILYVILFGSGILRYGFHIILYHRILYYSILYLCSVLRIIFYLFEVISRSPKRTSLRIIDNIIQSWGWNVISETFDLLWKLIYNNANFCPPEGLAHFEKQWHLLLHSSPCSVHVHFLTMSNFNVRVSRDSHDENPE